MTKPKRLLAKKLAELKAIVGPNYVIKIVEKRNRGRPEKVPVMQGALVLTLDEMMEEYCRRGLTERKARQSAFAELKEAMETEDPDGHPLPEGKRRRSLTTETFERYYRAGVKELRDSEMWLAKEIDAIIAKQGKEAVPQYDPCGVGGVTWRRYRRGTRALAPLGENRKNNRLIDFL
jgi:hypothetical protein